ncbi:hypothetical protein [Candidatus Amarolinea dominans]|uniref:hypothetical protein n=1 Tax=Candidatus Amarolinea dominans TaxID=3140696 RepID=UPI003136012D|nr:hypothetical protein [Anaerolineae bacterium]
MTLSSTAVSTAPLYQDDSSVVGTAWLCLVYWYANLIGGDPVTLRYDSAIGIAL